MKKSVLIILAAFLLAACGPAQEPSEPAAESSLASEGTESSQVSQPESSPESSTEPEESSASAGFTPVEGRQITCENLIPAWVETPYDPDRMFLEDGELYYSVERDGKWGLIDENGNEILPCQGDSPFQQCYSGHWMTGYYLLDGELEQQVLELTGQEICPGHGNPHYTYCILPEGDTALQTCLLAEGNFSMSPFEEEAPDQPVFPVFFPYESFNLEEELPDLNHPFGFWNFTDASGNQLAEGMEFENVGWFNGEKLAPVCQDGKWAYLDAEGNLVTDFVYDACWGSDWVYDENTQEYGEISPYAAYSLTGGYAPVCKDGKWGVIDETGAEIIPCSYDGGAPYPGGVWLAEGDAWQLYLFE